MKRLKQLQWIPILLGGILALGFVLLFYYDNKYQTPPPYGKNGVLQLREGDLTDRPLFLIDGWLLTDSRASHLPTYIGQYSNLQRGDHMAPPHGKAYYQLILRYTGNPLTVAVHFPKLSTDYVISLDDTVLASGSGNGQVIFSLRPGDQTLTVETVSRGGYYSGMYFPPALGQPEMVSRIQRVQAFAYALAFLTPLVLAVFTFALWRQRSDPPAFWAGLLCQFFALYVAHYFVYLFALPLLPHWNLVEGIAMYGLIFCVIHLTALSAEMTKKPICRLIQLVLFLLPLLLIVLYLCIPLFPQAVVWHGNLTDFYYIVTFCGVCFLAARAALYRSFEYRYILAGCVVFGSGLLLNLFFSNRFEPIRFFWQFEWCGLLLVLLFGGMMAARNRRILEENAEFSRHLEQLVDKRTQELQTLLDQRKAFFSHMAHDLKAPIFATQAFIRAIRENDTGVDGELLRYIDAAEQKQKEMSRRVQGLNAIHELDKISTRKTPVSMQALLEEVYASHNGEAEVSSIHLRMEPPAEDCYLLAQPEKLEILFENLIFNAIRATPAEGSITLSAQVQGERVRITVADTGHGIPAQELPQIFNRFYVGERNKETGSGLGLYIVQSIVTELGGEISVTSQVDVGTEFAILFPLVQSPPSGNEA